MPDLARVTDVRVDDAGISASTDAEVVVDVLFDDRRIWSFWLQRDGRREGARHVVPWPPALRRFLNGTTRLKLVEHVNQRVLYDDEVRLGDATGDTRIAVVNDRGQPLGLDKSLRLAQTFDTRSAEHVAPLLDAIDEVLAALKKAGIDAFPAYGTLLGAVRGGKLIGHDSDADLGYVSEHTHPVDVARESFDLQRAMVDMGYRVTRYSGAAFKVDVEEADGSVRGLDVFGGFMSTGPGGGDHLYLMGEIGTPFRREWVHPLGTTTLEGRELPAPANTDEFLTATYGPTWRVPDPAYVFGTPESTHRRLNGWFRGTRVNRDTWERTYSRNNLRTEDLAHSPFADWVLSREPDTPDLVVDVGCGRGGDVLRYAEQGARAVGLDYVLRASTAADRVARDRGLPAEFRGANLCELRQTLVEGTRLAHEPGTVVVTARHFVETTDRVGREHLWRLARMATAGGGRLYLELLVRRGEGDDFHRRHNLRAVSSARVERELVDRGATVLHKRVRDDDPNGRRICRMVVEWQRAQGVQA